MPGRKRGTRRVILARIPTAAQATLFAPDHDAAGGSEVLWSTLQPSIGSMRRALILRAQHGREWLGERLAQAHVTVETLAVYTRRVATIAPAAAASLRRWQQQHVTPVLVVASSEAVDVLVSELDVIVDSAWLRSALALAAHERIAVRLRSAGFPRVMVTTLDVEAIRKATLAQ